ncbi:MAG: carboxypeptidase regulatory-like domain-containing protein [Thermoleophilaceae bacterium]|nr:carboxypeptidase regulatory-like domain-containing protein [Thermoleophilaceae bacterium]
MSDGWRTTFNGRRAPIWLAALVAALLGGAVMAGGASAGTYSVYSCEGPSGEVLGDEAWVPHLSNLAHFVSFSLGPQCSEYSVVAVSGLELLAGENAGLRFDAPVGTTISGYSVRRSASVVFAPDGDHPALSVGLRRTVNSVSSYSGECEAVESDCEIAPSGTQSAGLTASQLQLGVECAQTSAVCASGGFTTLRTRLFDSRVDLKDLTAPVVALTGGTLPGAGGAPALRTLDVWATDIGGGIRNVTLSVDGAPVASRDSGGSCSTPYTKAAPCPLISSQNFSLDLGSMSVGTHSAVVTAVDAAGNLGTLAPITFTVGGVDANGLPAGESPALTTLKPLISVRSTRKVSVAGVLRTSSGRAISGATLEVTATSVGAAAETSTRLGSVKTDADGAFAFKVKPNGALRITFTFRPSAGAQSIATASTTVRQKIALSARRSEAKLRRGAQLTVAGRLSGAGRAAAAVPVEIQVKNGRRWSRVALVQTDPRGSYKWRYRFKRVTRPTLFTFRAAVLAKPDWPWPGTASAPVQVLVRR